MREHWRRITEQARQTGLSIEELGRAWQRMAKTLNTFVDNHGNTIHGYGNIPSDQ